MLILFFQVREHYKEQHTALHARSQTILERCSGHINGLEEAYAEWAHLSKQENALKNEIEVCERQLGPLETGWSTENYKAGLAELYELEARLDKVEIKRGLLRSRVIALSDTVSSPELTTIEDSPVDYQLPGLKAQAERLKIQVEKFQDHWTEYEEGQTTLQPWLAVAEEQLEKNGGSPNLLLQAELNTYNRLREKANNNFSAATDTLPGLQDEEFQRRLHLQFEERWKRFGQKMTEQQRQNEETNTIQSKNRW